jgi:hypothetical protein
MCGIWGFITNETTKGEACRLKFVYQSAVVGTLRGTDSAGTIIVGHTPREGGADWVKAVGTGEEFLATKYAQDRLKMGLIQKYRAVIGHNRAATTGKINSDNAHPFQDGPITLVHNGTLNYTSDMPVPMHVGKKNTKIEVDSHLICHNLALHDRNEVLESLEGAFALVWHDARDDTIYMARNSQRPLHLMRAKCEDTVLFASEPDMLWWLAGRNQFTRGVIHSLDAGVLLSFAPKETRPTMSRFSLYRPRRAVYGGRESVWEDYDGYPTRAAPGKERATAPLPAVTVAGTTKLSRKMLEELGIDPKVPTEFSVASVIEYPNSQLATVNGWAYFTEKDGSVTPVQAIIHGMAAEFCRKKRDAVWIVRPIGVTTVGSKQDSEPALICRMVQVKEDEDAPKSGGSSPTEKSVADGPHTKMYRGPANTFISAHDWLELTKGGCDHCRTTLTLADAEEVAWVWGYNPRPLCSLCARHWNEDEAFLTRETA